jgi:uncharacterized protein YecT (DUF1311 family)
MITTSDRFFVNTIIAMFSCFVVSLSFPNAVHAWMLPKSGMPVPNGITGTWQVTKVNIDTGSSRTMHVQYNDPAEKGRIIDISPNKITHDGLDWMICVNPTVTVRRSTAAELVKDSMGWRGYDPEVPTPKDYELPVGNKKQVDTLWIHCGKGDFGPDTKDISKNTWILPLPDGRLAMRWFDESIVILSRLPANAKPNPSFDCAKAKSPEEKTICGSVSLSSFDRSVAEAYVNAVRVFKEIEVEDHKGLKRLKATQKAWLSKRNTCGANTACLKKSMLHQLEVLSER